MKTIKPRTGELWYKFEAATFHIVTQKGLIIIGY